MSRGFLIRACAVGTVLTVAGCASVTSGTTQAIVVNSDPIGADCTLTREGLSLGTVKTPGPITVKRDSRAIHVSCAMPGYEDGKVVLNSRYETATMGNMFLGGAIGMMVDASTGASNRYDAQVTVPLTPLAGGQFTASAPGVAPTSPSVVPQSALAARSDQSGNPAPFLTGPWQAWLVLNVDRSAGGCTGGGGSSYSLDLAGDTFVVDNVNGRMLSTTVPADGTIDQSFRSPSGARLQIVGNARTRDLEIVNSRSGCRWKLMSAAASDQPVSPAPATPVSGQSRSRL